jgi:sialic acid synthase SpsE
MFQESIHVDNYHITRESSPFFVAEIGLNHNADLEIGKRTIESAKKSGAHAVKFQTYITDNFIHPNREDVKFLYDIFKKYELNEKLHREFQKTAHDLGLVFFSTPLDPESCDLLQSLNVPVIKIASGDIVNPELLSKAASLKKPIFLSTGASRESEVVQALEFLKDQDVEELCLFHCISQYPAPPENLNLKTLDLLSQFTDGPLGFSDHSSGGLASALAIGMGASVIEKHYTLDHNLDGPDHTISLNPSQFLEMTKLSNEAHQMRGKAIRQPNSSEKAGWFYGRRSLYQINGKWRSMRPALHTKDPSIPTAWDWVSKNQS